MTMEKNSRIYVAGGGKTIGAAILRTLDRRGYANVIPPGDEPDYTDRAAVRKFFAAERPEYVFVAGGRAGGIAANQKRPAELMYDNLCQGTNVIAAAQEFKVRKLLYLAGSCCYPGQCRQPMREQDLWTGPLEPTNEAYATAKLAGIMMCLAYRRQYGAPFVSAIPANYFGPGDDFSPEDSHVIGGLIRRMHQAVRRGDRSVTIWGTGRPRREFIFVDDLAEACLKVMDLYDDDPPINIGAGGDMSIVELAGAIKAVTGFGGEIVFDTSKPDGMMVKSLDTSRLQKLGWKAESDFRTGLAATYEWYLENVDSK